MIEELDEYKGIRAGSIVRPYSAGYWEVIRVYKDLSLNIVRSEHRQIADRRANPPRNMVRSCAASLCTLVTEETLQDEIDVLLARVGRIRDQLVPIVKQKSRA